MSFLEDDKRKIYELDSTKQLMEDTLGLGSFSRSRVGGRFNNTANLLDDRTSMLTEDKISRLICSKMSDNSYLKDEEARPERLNITEDCIA
jgi:hypothetical protein